MSILINSLMVTAVLGCGFFVLARYLETGGVFFPKRIMAISPEVLGLPWEDVYFKTNDGVILNGWFFRNPKARSTILFAHGNAGNISDRLSKIKFLYDLGLNVFIFEFNPFQILRPNQFLLFLHVLFYQTSYIDFLFYNPIDL